MNPISLRLPYDVSKALENICKKDNRTLSNAIITLLRQSLKLPAKKI
jgi:hypothetical protein